MSTPFSGKPVKVNFLNKRIQFNENESSNSVFRPMVVFDYLSEEEINDLRASGVASNLLPPSRGGDYPATRGSNLLTSWSVGPWGRLGEEVVRKESTYTQGELSDVSAGSTRIGRVTILGEDGATQTNQQDIEKYDAHRQGKDMQNFEQFSKTLLPVVRISPESFFSYDNVFNHNYGDQYFGYGLEFKIFDENFTIIPFKDFGKLNPADLIGKTNVLGYPIVTDLSQDFEQYVNPADPGFNGSIDIFYTRTSIIDSIFDYIPTGIKGEYMGSSLENNRKGSSIIVSEKEINERQQFVFFEDLQDLEFGSYNFPSGTLNYSEASGYKYLLPDMINQNMSILNPFKDENFFRFKSDNYELINSLDQKNQLLSGSDRSKSLIGESFKSSTCGLIFGESNVLGTDSIAFGGFKK